MVQCVLAIVKYNFFALFSFSVSSYFGFLFLFFFKVNVFSFRFYLASLAPLQLSPYKSLYGLNLTIYVVEFIKLFRFSLRTPRRLSNNT